MFGRSTTLFGQSTSTRAALAPRFAGIALGALSGLTGSRWLMLLACACGGVLIVALLLRPKLDQLTITVSAPARTSVDSEIDCIIEVTNHGTDWSPLMHGVHRAELLDDVTFRVDPLPAGVSATLSLTRIAQVRGVVTASTVDLATTAPLGLRLRHRTVGVPMRLIVHPAQVPVALLPPRALTDNTSWVVSRTGVDVHGIREWRPGDDASQVHWRSSARRGRLIVLEREIPRPGGLALVLAAAVGDPDWERVVSVGAWTGVAAVRSGREVVLVSTVSGDAQPGPDDATTILDWCAQSQPALPADGQLRGAFTFAGRDGEVAVAAGASARREWWHWASSLAEAAGVTLVALPLDDALETATGW
ncbi:MAG: DUF58 domain-containing protein [Mycobacteriales bacterium]